MEKKTKKTLAIVIPVVAILLIALIIVLVVVLSKKDNTPENQVPEHTKHTYVYTSVNDTQHKKTCSGCTEVDELEKHEYDNEQDATCNRCPYLRIIESNAPTSIKLTADKTELTAGDTFTITLEIATNRTDLVWSAINLTIVPLISETGKPSTDLSRYFECVSYTQNFDTKYYRDYSKGLFDKNVNTGMYICIANRWIKSIPTTEKFVFTAELKVKADAPTIPSFEIGIPELKEYNIEYKKADATYPVVDKANNETYVDKKLDESVEQSIALNRITVSIKAKED